MIFRVSNAVQLTAEEARESLTFSMTSAPISLMTSGIEINVRHSLAECDAIAPIAKKMVKKMIERMISWKKKE